MINSLRAALLAAVYQCQVDGATTFTDRPCRGPGHEVVLDLPAVPDPSRVDYGAVNARLRDRLATRHRDRRISGLQGKIHSSQRVMDGYRAQMNRELSWARPADEHAAIRGYWDSRVSDQARAIDGYRRDIEALRW